MTLPGADPIGETESQITFAQLADAMPQMVWSTRPDGSHDYYNAQWYEFTGVPPGSTDGDGWNDMFHPDDQERAWARWRHSLESGEPYEIEYRLRHHSGQYRWTLGRALPVHADGRIIRWVGTCTDIHDQKQMAEQNDVLSRELSHRIKNIFAVVNGLIGFSAREFPPLKELARQLQSRIAALGRAHDFVRPHSEESRPQIVAATLHALLREILSPYPALDDGRLTIAGEDHPVDDRSATPLALIFHELATNAVKYGALSDPAGRISLVSRLMSGSLSVEWRETGGPTIAAPPRTLGFGSRLTDMSVIQQLGGTVERKWEKEGLYVRIEVPAAALNRA
jgi:PAS domain S-box-containing protein